MRLILLALWPLAAGPAAFAADHPPADHAGADLTLADGDRIWGLHTGVATFSVPAPATVFVAHYDGAATTDWMAQEKELAWARGVIGRYESRMQAMANRIDGYEATAKARAEGREPTFAELATHRHIETERYE